jgi:hypothetical protein
MKYYFPDFPTNTSSGGATGIKNKQELILFSDYPDYRTHTSSGGSTGINKKI